MINEIDSDGNGEIDFDGRLSCPVNLCEVRSKSLHLLR